ncbi:PRC-barrel domain-containing protein [Fictibacillus halophilus]|uniref:PRC-barrel domain-containing protein n=1 Tax=Fictibacillus halophilus TaxID=1610490 RepID=UPI001CFAB36D|nr:PRC-barrel domain-containing protein [Fictibacillus halophilus]
MKKSNDFIGLPIICIQDGTEAGHVKSLVVNSKLGVVDFLIVEHEEWELSIRAIPFNRIISVGEFAVMIENRSSILDLTEIPIANQLVQKKLNVSGAKLIDKKGQLIGEAREYFIDETNGAIIGFEISLISNIVVFAADQVVTYGRDLIVNEESGLNFFQKVESIKPRQDLAEEELQQAAATKVDTSNSRKLEESVEKNQDSIKHKSEPQSIENIKEKQLKLLTGKTTIKDIYTRDGDLLFNTGTTLTAEDVQKAQEKGPAVLAELTMNLVG